MSLDPYLTTYIKINYKSIRDLNVKLKTRRKHKERLHGTGFDNDFIYMTAKHRQQNTDKLDFMRILKKKYIKKQYR